MTAQGFTPPPPHPCGCAWDGFCDDHRAKMGELRDVWDHGSEEAFAVIWSLQDGYGEPGYLPPQGYDWSGIRDSSPEAIDLMHAALHA